MSLVLFTFIVPHLFSDLEPERNCFVAIKSPYFPLPLAWWQRGFEKLMELQCHTGQSLLKLPLPHPVIFLTKDDCFKFDLFLMWLHICPVILWQLGLLNTPVFTNKNWKALIEGAQGSAGPGLSSCQTKMLEKLRGIVAESQSIGISIDEENIVSTPATWNNKEVTLNAEGSLDHHLVQEILWELFEGYFCLEIITLDCAMVPKP